MESAVKPLAVLFDRDGTLIVDVPYNGDPELVVPMPHALQCVARLRERGVKIGLVSNQSGIGRGMIDRAQVEAVNRRVAELFGAFDVVLYCPHAPHEGCACRKPLPGMILDAARALGVSPAQCIVVGDKQSDVEAARGAGARAIMMTDDTFARDLPAAFA